MMKTTNNYNNQFFYSVCYYLPFGLIIIDRYERIEFLNKKAKKILKINENIIDKHIYEINKHIYEPLNNEEFPLVNFWDEAIQSEKDSCEIILDGKKRVNLSIFQLRSQTKKFIGYAILLQENNDNNDFILKVRDIAEELLSLTEEDSNNSECSNIKTLTAREQEIFDLLGKGVIRNNNIAERLDISENTVKKHISNIFHKLNINSRTEAALLAVNKEQVS